MAPVANHRTMPWGAGAWGPQWMCLLTIIFLSVQFETCTSIFFHPSLKFTPTFLQLFGFDVRFPHASKHLLHLGLTNWLYELSQSHTALPLSSSRTGCKGLPIKDTVSLLAGCPRCLWTCQNMISRHHLCFPLFPQVVSYEVQAFSFFLK